MFCMLKRSQAHMELGVAHTARIGVWESHVANVANLLIAGHKLGGINVFESLAQVQVERNDTKTMHPL